MRDTSTLTAVHPGLLLALVAVGMGSAVIFVPRDKELYARLMTDRQEERVIEMAAGNADPLQPARAESLDSGPVQPPTNESTTASGEENQSKTLSAFDQIFGKFDFEHLGSEDSSALSSLLRHTEHPTECWETLLADGRFSSLPAEQSATLGDALAQAALAAGKPALAAEIYSAAAKDLSAAPVDVLLRAVTTYRYNNAASPALAMIDAVEQRQGLTTDEKRIQFELCQAAAPARTFELIKRRLAEQPDLNLHSELLEALEGVADETQRGSEMLNLWGQFLQRFPQHSMTPAELAKARQQDSGGAERKLYAVWAWRVAQNNEWSGRYPEALKLTMQAAALGIEPALARAESLADEINQEQEYISLLAAILPLAGHDDLTLKLARGLAKGFQYSQAVPQYESYLRELPGDAKVRFELGCLHAELGETERAETQLALAAKSLPEDEEVQTRWAQALLRQRKFPEALAIYRAMPEKAHTTATLENYRLLADSLNQQRDLLRTQRLALRLKSTPEPADYVDLAEVEVECGEPETGLLTLAQGRNAHPKSRLLILASARMLRDRGQLSDAQSLLARLDLRHDLEAACQMVEICSDLDRGDAILSVITKDATSAQPWPPDVAMQLASLCAAAGREGEARGLWLAAARQDSLHAADAVAELTEAEAESDDPSTWILLGDALRGLGRSEEAEQAYQKSLQLIQEQAAANRDRQRQSQNDIPTSIPR